MLNVLIFEDNTIKLKDIFNFMQTCNLNCKVLSLSYCEDEAINSIQNNNIDIILVDINCISENFLEYIKEISSNIYKKSIIAFSDSNNIPDFIINYKSLFYKIILNQKNYNNLIDIIKSMIDTKINIKTNFMNSIYLELEKIGFSISYDGTKYLMECIYLKFFSSHKVDLTNDIYPIVAKKYNTNINNIKVGIFNSTDTTYNNCNKSIMENYFGYKLIKKPTTKELIDIVIKHIKKY